YQSPRPPPLATTKSNSLSLPDSPTVAGYQRGRSNSLRVIDDILMRRSNSLRQGLMNVGRRKSSLEDIGLSHFSTNYNNPIKIALNGSIGLEVTPPEENSPPVICSNTALITNPPLPPSVFTGSTLSLGQTGIPTSSGSLPQQLNVGISVPNSAYSEAMPPQISLPSSSPSVAPSDPQHLQGTIV
ncbi:hypothetical protein HHI36_019446, partial [Cryptolaemus montrouzieri]